MITAKRFDNGTVVKADKWSQVQFFSAGKKLDTRGSRAIAQGLCTGDCRASGGISASG